jgi:drug/metabolite transporter (DMT)-like permease
VTSAAPFVLLPGLWMRTAVVGRKHWIAFAALGVVWGTTWVAADTLAEQVPPLRGAAVRFLLAALLLLPVILLKRLKLPRGRVLGVVLILSLTMIVAPFVLLLWARQHVPSATVAVIFGAMPLLVALLAPVLENRRGPRSAMQAELVGLGAIALAMGASISAAQAGGAAVVLLAVACVGGSSVVAHRELRSLNPVVTSSLLLGTAAPLLFLASFALERGQPVEWNANAIGALVFLAVPAGAAGYATYFWLLQQLEAYQVATLQWMQPLVATLESAFFLRQGLSFSMIAGSIVALVTLVMVMRARAEDDNTVSLRGN